MIIPYNIKNYLSIAKIELFVRYTNILASFFIPYLLGTLGTTGISFPKYFCNFFIFIKFLYSYLIIDDMPSPTDKSSRVMTRGSFMHLRHWSALVLFTNFPFHV